MPLVYRVSRVRSKCIYWPVYQSGLFSLRFGKTAYHLAPYHRMVWRVVHEKAGFSQILHRLFLEDLI